MTEHDTITLEIRIKVPKGASVEVTTEGEAEALPDNGPAFTLLQTVERRIEAETPLRLRQYIDRFLDHCREAGLSVTIPDGKRQDYLNVYAGQPAIHGGRRIASVNIRSGLATLQCVPENAEDYANDFSHAETVYNNKDAWAVSVRLSSDGAVFDAVALCDTVLEERVREMEQG